MSIGSVGAAGSGGLSQVLARMLSRLDGTNSSPSNSTDTSASIDTGSPDGGSSNGLTGVTQSSLSDRIVGLLVMMQNRPDHGDGSQAPSSNPIDSAFKAIDGDDDGTISQSELESVIENAGGTQSQADELYSVLAQNDGSGTGITEDQFADAAMRARPGGQGPRPMGPPPSGAASLSDSASQIFDTLDTDKDGTVSAEELAAAFSKDDSSTAGTSDLLSQIDGNGDGSVSRDELQSFLTALEDRMKNDFATAGTLSKLALQSYQSAESLDASGTTAASTYA